MAGGVPMISRPPPIKPYDLPFALSIASKNGHPNLKFYIFTFRKHDELSPSMIVKAPPRRETNYTSFELLIKLFVFTILIFRKDDRGRDIIKYH